MDEQQLQEQIVLLVLAAMQGDQLAAQQIELIMLAAQLGDQLAALIALLILEVAQQLLGQQVLAAKFGAKLNYIRTLRGECPFGTEPLYFRSGGKVCKRCVRKGQNGMAPKDPVTEFKTVSAKCGKKMRKKDCGGTVRKALEGALITPDLNSFREAMEKRSDSLSKGTIPFLKKIDDLRPYPEWDNPNIKPPKRRGIDSMNPKQNLPYRIPTPLEKLPDGVSPYTLLLN